MKSKDITIEGKCPTKKEVSARAAQLALDRHKNKSNSRLSQYQIRNLKKVVTQGNTAVSKANVSSKMESSKDLKMLKLITDEANTVLKKYK